VRISVSSESRERKPKRRGDRIWLTVYSHPPAGGRKEVCKREGGGKGGERRGSRRTFTETEKKGGGEISPFVLSLVVGGKKKKGVEEGEVSEKATGSSLGLQKKKKKEKSLSPEKDWEIKMSPTFRFSQGEEGGEL